MVLAESTIPGSGDGVFAVRDIEKGCFIKGPFSNLFTRFARNFTWAEWAMSRQATGRATAMAATCLKRRQLQLQGF